MQLKTADDRQPDLDALAALLARPDVDERTRTRIESEIRQTRAGIAGERDAAYEVEFCSKGRPGRVTIHDLRIEHEGRVAQIDHLIITRFLDFWVLESKHFVEGVAINDFGEWTAFYGGRPRGIPSPVEQNARHIAVLQDLLASGAIDLPKRIGLVTIRPLIRGLVLVSNGARISRPRSKAARAAIKGLDTVIKAEQLGTMIERDAEQRSVATVLKLVGGDATERIGRQLVELHKPATFDWPARFGLPASPPEPAAATPDNPPESPTPAEAPTPASRPVCAECSKAVSPAVVAYCEQNRERFAGQLYCYDCQRAVRRRSKATSG